MRVTRYAELMEWPAASESAGPLVCVATRPLQQSAAYTKAAVLTASVRVNQSAPPLLCQTISCRERSCVEYSAQGCADRLSLVDCTSAPHETVTHTGVYIAVLLGLCCVRAARCLCGKRWTEGKACNPAQHSITNKRILGGWRTSVMTICDDKSGAANACTSSGASCSQLLRSPSISGDAATLPLSSVDSAPALFALSRGLAIEMYVTGMWLRVACGDAVSYTHLTLPTILLV